MGSSIPRSGHQTCCGTEERASLASISTIVVVAGQTQVHTVTLAAVRLAVVPGPGLSGMQMSQNEGAYCLRFNPGLSCRFA